MLVLVDELCRVSRSADAGRVPQFSTYRSLVQLHLSAPDVTDAGLRHLEVLTDLFDLELQAPKVSERAIHRLELAIPNVRPSVNKESFGFISFSVTGLELE